MVRLRPRGRDGVDAMTREQAQYDADNLPHQIKVARSMGCHAGETVESMKIRSENVRKLKDRLAKTLALLVAGEFDQ